MRASLLPLSCLLSLLMAASVPGEPVELAKPEMIIDARGLGQLLDGGAPVVVLDVRARQLYDRSRVPSAKWVDIAEWKGVFNPNDDPAMEAAAWGKRIGRLGISEETTVVVYDRFTSPSATRAWWVLRYWGVEDVRVLDGGYADWQRRNPSVDLASLRDTPSVEFAANPQPDRLATYDEVVAAVAGDSAGAACVLDTRTALEFAAGAIPTAKLSDWAEYVDPQTGRLRPPAELLALLTEAGYKRRQPAITYCRTGGRASLVAFVMELMGGEQVANYWGSWTDWSRVRLSPIPAAPSVPAATQSR